MSKFFEIEPVGAGVFGEGTVVDQSVNPWSIKKVTFAFTDLLDDSCVGYVGEYFVTKALKQSLEALEVTGVKFEEIEVIIDEVFEQRREAERPGFELPTLYWLHIDGAPDLDDFCKLPDLTLVVSERVLNAMREHGLESAEVWDYPRMATEQEARFWQQFKKPGGVITSSEDDLADGS